MLRSFPWTDTAPKAPRTSLSCISGRPRAPTRVFQPRPAGPRRWLVSRAGGETVEHGQKYHSRAPKKTLRGRWWDLGQLACRRLSFGEIISPVYACSVPHLQFSIGSCATWSVWEAVRGVSDTLRGCEVVGYSVPDGLVNAKLAWRAKECFPYTPSCITRVREKA